MLEQHAGEAVEVGEILAERGVFKLHHVDLVQIDLPMDQPFKIGIGELANRERK